MIDGILKIWELIVLILLYVVYCILLKFHGKIQNYRCGNKKHKPEISLENPDNQELSNNHEVCITGPQNRFDTLANCKEVGIDKI